MITTLVTLLICSIDTISWGASPQVAAGANHTIFLHADGTLWGSGLNLFGQLGDGSFTSKQSSAQIGTARDWNAIAAGADHNLALKTNGTLWGWGRADSGQLGKVLGNGLPIANQNAPVQIGTAHDWIAIAAASGASYALKGDGTLWAWGNNAGGRLGNGDGTGAQVNQPVQVLNPSGTPYVAIACGASHALALQADGSLWAWGGNTSGQLGQGSADATVHATPLQVIVATAPSDFDWHAIAAGDAHSVALKADGTLWSWGDNAQGQLGIGSTVDGSTPVQVGLDHDWSRIAAGSLHTLALRRSGLVWGFGDNRSGQLGIGSTAAQSSPAPLAAPTDVIALAAGAFHSLLLQAGGQFYAFGDNGTGQFGNGSAVSALAPEAVAADALGWLASEPGNQFTVALRSNGTLWGWGDNANGQLGDGSLISRSTPAQIGTATTWTAHAAGFSHVAALRSDGTLWSWGDNSSGQLGNNTLTPSLTPIQITATTPVSASNDWTAVASGDFHTLALKADGTLWAWGDNTSGQLGLNSNTAAAKKPNQVITGNPGNFDSNWVAIAAGGSHSLGLQADGSLWAWGDNTDGQLGDPAVVGSIRTPNQVINFTPPTVSFNFGWKGIAAGFAHSLALQSDGTLWAFGSNFSGQLGNGDPATPNPANQSTPVAVLNAGAVPYTALAAGDSHSLARRADGTVWSFGSNTSGQLGIGSTDPNPFNPLPHATPLQETNLASDWAGNGVGGSHSVGTKGDGTLWLFGSNLSGQLGDGTTNDRNFAAPLLEAFLSVSTTLDFGSSAIGASAVTRSLSIANPGNGTLFVTGIALSGSDAALFNVSGGNCGGLAFSLSSKGSCQLQLGFAPNVPAGSKSALISIDSSDPIQPQAQVALSGVAVQPFILTTAVTPAAGGSITPAGPLLVLPGSSQSFSFAASNGYHVADVLLNGVSQGVLTGLALSSINGNADIAVTFALNPHTITLNAGAHGSIVGPTSTTEGATPSYSIVPATGYHVADVTVNGTSQGAVTALTLPPVTADVTIAASFAINNYAITLNAGTNGAITGPANGDFGTTPSYSITPATGYHVVDVTVNTVSQGALTALTLPALSGNVAIAATFAINNYAITLNAGANGAITGPANGDFGTTPSYLITPATGYHVADVTVNGTSQGAVTSLTLPALSGNVTVAASFAINSYAITLNAGANGAITGPATANFGTTPSYSIAPATGYHILDVTVNTVSQGAITTLTLPAVSGNVAIQATFAINSYAITLNPGANGAITGPASGDFGTTPSYSITPVTGYHVVDVILNGASQGALTSLTLPALSGNVTIQATFAINNYAITLNAGANGTLTGPASADFGTTPSYTIAPATGYHIADVTVNGASQGALTALTLPTMNGNVTIAASFAINNFPVTLNAGANGAITGPANANFGTTPSYTITPITGFHVVDVTVNGVSQGALTALTLPAVSGNVTIAASFAINSYTVNLVGGPNGAIAGPATVTFGATPTYTFTPNLGSFIAGVTVNGVVQGTVSSVTLPPVGGNVTIAVDFGVFTFAITATGDAQGSISPADPVLVPYGSSQTYSFTPNAGYQVVDVFVDGVSQGAIFSYTFTNVTANGHTLKVLFTPDGDLNGDGKVDLTDALRALQISVGLITPTDAERRHADVAPLSPSGIPAPDGQVGISDALVILRKVVGLTSGF